MFTKHVQTYHKQNYKMHTKWVPKSDGQIVVVLKFLRSPPQDRMGSRASPDRLHSPKASQNEASKTEFRRLLEQEMIESLWLISVMNMVWLSLMGSGFLL